jgi:hypothetical protein
LSRCFAAGRMTGRQDLRENAIQAEAWVEIDPFWRTSRKGLFSSESRPWNHGSHAQIHSKETLYAD